MEALWTSVLYGIVAFITLSVVLLVVRQWKAIQRSVREPVLKYPIVIVESDDWSPGPDTHAEALETIKTCLQEFTDRHGRHPVMALGLVLSAPDGKAIRDSEALEYHAIHFDDTRSRAILRAIRDGLHSGVFSAQLHGMEHFWPETLRESLAGDRSVMAWGRGSDFPQTEALPSHLQSRWTDASRLPSVDLPRRDIDTALQQESDEFTRIFGYSPTVYVPTTFVWGDSVEKAVSRAGVRVFVTPGFRNTGRDRQGRPQRERRQYFNGEVMTPELVAVVRDIYFEPREGHRADDVVTKVAEKVQCGRPALLETHRINFTFDPRTKTRSIEEMTRLLSAVQQRFPNTRFVSTDELGQIYDTLDHEWIEHGHLRRLRVWVHRLARLPGIGKVLRLTGVVGLLRWVDERNARHTELRSV